MAMISVSLQLQTQKLKQNGHIKRLVTGWIDSPAGFTFCQFGKIAKKMELQSYFTLSCPVRLYLYFLKTMFVRKVL
jgi:hypothetical protein